MTIPYLAKKLCALILSLFCVATLTFFIMHAIPGDPFTDEQALPRDVHEALQHHYQLDQPLSIQYARYLQSLFHGQLGPSLKYPGRTVNTIIQDSFPISALLGIEALSLALSLGLVLGVAAALKHNTWTDYAILLTTALGLSLPSFILAAFLQYTLGMKLHLLPIARWGSWEQSILPALALAAAPTSFITRLVRASMLETFEQDFIKMAQAKGLSRWKINLKHALRHACLPVLTYLGPLTANVLVGSFVIEKIFSIPGLGQWFVNSVSNRDYSVIMGLTLFYSTLLMAAGWIVDLLYRLLDPRIKVGE